MVRGLGYQHLSVGLIGVVVMVLSQYRAVSNYAKQDRKELSFKEGDIFEVVEKNDNGKDSHRGWELTQARGLRSIG
jgi:hypothetical protein